MRASLSRAALAALASLCASAATDAKAAGYPDKPVQIIADFGGRQRRRMWPCVSSPRN